MDSTTKEILKELPALIKLYKDGSVERLFCSPNVPPSIDQETGVTAKDITISQDPLVSARLYLPKLVDQSPQKLPILVYFHGGGFCLGSAFTFIEHRYLNKTVSQAQVLAVSIEYRLAPEHPLPAAYEDSWSALQWVASHSVNNSNEVVDKDEWLLNYADFDRLYIGGDSAGANIVHNIAIRAGIETLKCGVKILGAFLSHPFFWGSEAVGRETSANRERDWAYLTWDLVYPSAENGIDNFMINPAGSEAKSLALLALSRLLICVAEQDVFRDRGVWYCDLVKESGWRGEMELFEVKGEGHVFHVLNPQTENAESMFKRLAAFMH